MACEVAENMDFERVTVGENGGGEMESRREPVGFSVVGQSDVEKQVQAKVKAQMFELKSTISADLTFYEHKLKNLYSVMMMCIDALDSGKGVNVQISLSTFAPVVREIAEELVDLRDEVIWEGMRC